MISRTLNRHTVNYRTEAQTAAQTAAQTPAHAESHPEAQTTTRSLACCQNQELLELLEIHAEHVRQTKPACRWTQGMMLKLKPSELPGVGRMTLVFAALCTLVVASTLLALWVV